MEWYFIIYFFASILGIVVTFILYFLNRNKSLQPRLIALYLFLVSLIALHYGLFYTNFYLSYPYLWRSIAWATFATPVLAYLYVRSVLEQSYSLKKIDYLLFIPAILYTICAIPWYLKPENEKIALLIKMQIDKSLVTKEPEIYLPQGWGMTARILWGLLLLGAQFRLLYKISVKHKTEGIQLSRKNESILNWLYVFTFALIGFYLLISLQLFINLYFDKDLTWLINFTFVGIILTICFYLFTKPHILYGFENWFQETDANVDGGKSESFKIEKSSKKVCFTKEQELVYKIAIENHFSDSKPYLKKGYNINDLASELDMLSYQLSAFINQIYGKNFNEFINDYRVNYFVQLLTENPSIGNQYTLQTLGEQVGFKSQRVFISAVKKRTGKLPSKILLGIEA
jgi:AraC-like DNA-binding protein